MLRDNPLDMWVACSDDLLQGSDCVILQQHEEGLFRNIADLALRGVIVSWHDEHFSLGICNQRSRDEIVDLFEDMGFEEDLDATQLVLDSQDINLQGGVYGPAYVFRYFAL